MRKYTGIGRKGQYEIAGSIEPKARSKEQAEMPKVAESEDRIQVDRRQDETPD